MDNTEVTRKQLAEKITLELRDLPPQFLSIVLIQYALELTILARAYFIEDRIPLAKDCNEIVHKILGFVGNHLQNPNVPKAASMIQMIVVSATQKGRLQILNGALRCKVKGSGRE